MKTIAIHPDAQVPYHFKPAARAFNNFLRAVQPDMLASVGDEVDFPQISRWTRGLLGEYQGDLQKHVNEGVAYLRALREAFGEGEFHVTRSNHMDRPLKYLRNHAPGMAELDALQVENLLHFEELGITYHTKPYELAPGWMLVHGDEGGQSREGGRTALNLAKKFGKSVVCGHTHRAGLIPDVRSVNGRPTQVVWGMEVGNFMDQRKAGYLGGGSANWQMACGLLYVDGSKVTPHLIPLRVDGSFVVNGKEYRG